MRVTVRLALIAGILSCGLCFTSTPASAGTDDYPANLKSQPLGAVVDPWGFYNRYCTSFAAWRLSQAQPGFHNTMNGGRFSNAHNWDDNARALGYTVDTTPAPGSVAHWDANELVGDGGLGHVAIVEAVNVDGSVIVEDYTPTNGGFHRRYTARPPRYIHIADTAPASQSSPQPGIPGRDFDGDGRVDIAFIKARNTQSGRVEVHVSYSSRGLGAPNVAYVSGFSTLDTPNGNFMLEDMDGDTRADLVFIKQRNTGSGTIELFWARGSELFARITNAYATGFHWSEDGRGHFSVFKMDGDPFPDLVYVKSTMTGSGTVEVHAALALTGFRAFLSSTSAFSQNEHGRGFFTIQDMNADGRVDLIYVKLFTTGSGRIEVHWANGAWNFKGPLSNSATAFHWSEAYYGQFRFARFDEDPLPDLVYIKTRNSGSGRIELHSAPGGWRNFTVITASIATGFGLFDGSNGEYIPYLR